MRQVISSTSTQTLATSATRYLDPTGTGLWQTAEFRGSNGWSVAGTFSNLYVKWSAAPGGAVSETFTLRINGVNSALTVTVSGATASGTDITHAPAVAAGDRLVWIRTTSGGTPATASLMFSVEFVPTTADQSGYISHVPSAPSWTVPYYAGAFWGQSWATTRDSQLDEIYAVAGTLKRYDIMLSNSAGSALGSPGAGKSILFTLYKNGVAQDGSGGTVDTRVTISNAGSTGSWTGSLSVAETDSIVMSAAPTGAAFPSLFAFISTCFTATSPGLFMIGASNQTVPDPAAVNYWPPGMSSSWLSSETPTLPGSVTTYYLTKMQARFNRAPGGSASWAFQLRLNGATPGVSFGATLSAANTTASDTGAFTITSSDAWDLMDTPSSTPNTTFPTVMAVSFAATTDVPDFCSGGGSISVVADPTDGETFTGRTINPRSWLTLAYDDQDRSFSTDAANHPSSYHGGRKYGYLVNIGSITRQLSDRFSSYKMADCSISVDDTSRLMSTLEDTAASAYWANREGRIQLASKETIAAAGTPHTLFRGIWRGHTSRGLQRTLTFTDVLGSEFSDFNLEGTIPKRLVTVQDFPNAPEAAIGQVVPIAYGVLSDKVTTTTTTPGLTLNSDIPRPSGVFANDFIGGGTISGRLFAYVTAVIGAEESLVSNLAGTIEDNRGMYVNWFKVASADSYRIYFFNGLDGSFNPHGSPGNSTVARYVTHDNTTTDGVYGSDFSVLIAAITDGTDALSGGGTTATVDSGKGKIKPLYVGTRLLTDGNAYHEFLICGHAIQHIEGLYQDDVPIPDTDDTFLVPDDASWDTLLGGSTPYVTIGSNVYSTIYARTGTARGDGAADGSSVLTMNICGIEDVGDSTGLTITAAPRVVFHLLNNFVLQDYAFGTWPAAPVSDDGVPWLNSTSFDALEDIEIQRIGGDGYLAAMYLNAPLTLRDLLGRILTSFDMRFGQNQHGQVIAKHLDDFSTLSGLVTLTDVHDIVADTDIDRRLGELENKVVYDWDYRPADGTFETEGSTQQDDAAIAANRDRPAIGDRRQMYYVLDQATADDVNFRALNFGRYPPVYVDVMTTLHNVRVKLGDIVLCTDVDGIGATGWSSRPLWVLGIQTTIGSQASAPTVKLSCVDIKAFLQTHILPFPAGALSFAGLAPSLRVNGPIAVPAGSLAFTGRAPSPVHA